MTRTLFPGYSVGPDAYSDLIPVCARYGKTAVLIGGKRALAAAEELIRAQAAQGDLQILGAYWYGGEASVENIDALRAIPQVMQADMIFAVGGGKAIDTCKVLAQTSHRPFFTFPTIASTCASCTSLGILYHPDGSLREYSFSKIPPNHIFINTQIIASAPARYLWAGIGDTMAKHYESTVSSRGQIPRHADGAGIALSSMCAAPIQRWGEQAMADCKAHRVSEALEEVILAIIVSTGLVSNFVQVDFTTGLAHAVYNGFTIMPALEEHGHLHGEVVAYGILVLLTVDRQYEERDRVYAFSRSIGLPTCLADLHMTPDCLPAVTQKALAGIDVRVYPYQVTPDMVISGILELEEYHRQKEN
jgi:glycerol dehydrogenase-like iron-containing ADH family enzyme